eukprot:548783_1
MQSIKNNINSKNHITTNIYSINASQIFAQNQNLSIDVFVPYAAAPTFIRNENILTSAFIASPTFIKNEDILTAAFISSIATPTFIKNQNILTAAFTASPTFTKNENKLTGAFISSITIPTPQEIMKTDKYAAGDGLLPPCTPPTAQKVLETNEFVVLSAANNNNGRAVFIAMISNENALHSASLKMKDYEMLQCNK